MNKPTMLNDGDSLGAKLWQPFNIIIDFIRDREGEVGVTKTFVRIRLYHNFEDNTYNSEGKLINLYDVHGHKKK